MSLYPNFETSTLLELLAKHTRDLTEYFVNNKFGKEYENCKKIIEDLQLEIEARNKIKENKTSTGINLIN